MKILLAEDDEYLLSALLMALQHKGYFVVPARTGTEAKTAMLTTDFDLVLLDLGLPEMDGTEVISDIRSNRNETPIIVITARDSLEDKIHGLDLGANDYLVKPFDFRELEARIRALMRKSLWSNKVEIEFGGLQLNTNSGLLFLQDQQMDLTPKEALVLKTLMSRAGRVVSKRQIMEQISDWADESSENAIEILIHRLRKKLESSDVSISTVRGFGYKLEDKNNE